MYPKYEAHHDKEGISETVNLAKFAEKYNNTPFILAGFGPGAKEDYLNLAFFAENIQENKSYAINVEDRTDDLFRYFEIKDMPEVLTRLKEGWMFHMVTSSIRNKGLKDYDYYEATQADTGIDFIIKHFKYIRLKDKEFPKKENDKGKDDSPTAYPPTHS